jgi:O-antigen/teichoic acid export membrane protein
MAINQLKTGALLSYILIGLGSIISILYTPIMLRLLGQSEYGLYSLVGSVIAYLGLFNFGFGSAYIKYFSVYKANNDIVGLASLNGMFFLIFSALGILAVAAGLILAVNSDIIFGNKLTVYELSKARILMIIMVINTAITFPAIVFNSYISAIEKFVFQKVLLLVKTIASPLVMIPVLIMGYGSVGMAIVVTILALIIEIINVWFCFRKADFQLLFKKFEINQIKELFIFSSFIFMNLLVNQINWNVDRFIIGWFRGTVEVAVYSIAAQLNTYYLTFSTAISNVYIPRVNQMIASKCSNWELTELFARLGRLQFIVLSLVIGLLIFFGMPFINLWAGADYSRSYYMALIIMIPVTIPLIQNLGIEIQRAKNQHKFRSWVYLFIALGNILISIPLTKLFGGIGAAIGTSIALTIGNIFIMNWYYHTKVGLDIHYFGKQIAALLPALLIPAITGYLIMHYINLNYIPNFIIYATVFILIFSTSMWFIGLNKYEKDLISNPIRKLIGKFSKL